MTPEAKKTVLKIDRRYSELKRRSSEELRTIYRRSHRVSDLRGVSKAAMICDLLRDEFRGLYVEMWGDLTPRELRALAAEEN